MAVNLSLLPQISFAPQSPAETEAAILTAYERISGLTLQPADPVRLFLESLAYATIVQNGLIDMAGKQNLLAYASGANLDHLGALMGVARIPAQPARCTLRFTIGEQLAFAVPVPAGTRVSTQDGKIAFAAVSDIEIKPGELEATAVGYCTVPGLAASGLLAGQLCRLVDPLPYIVSASNIDTTTEGADVETDERLRERIRLAPESFTVAGSSGEYEARTLAVSAEISEVAVTTPEPGVVDVRFVLQDGELPDEAMCALVLEALSAEDVRPLTDHVLVGAPEPVPYAIKGTWQVKRSDAPMLATIAANVEKALEDYRLWQRGRPGRDIVPSRLVSLIQNAGAKRVQIEEPVFTKLNAIEIARETEIELVFAGLEEE